MGGLGILALAFFGLVLVFASGMPVAFGLLLINIVGFAIYAGIDALPLLADSAFGSIAQFTLVPVPLFLLMGELLVRAGFGNQIVQLVDDWMGRVPGRLSLSAVGAGAVFGAVSGSSMASTALLGSTLMGEMDRRRYHPQVSVGAILAAGGLAILIPPSALGVLLGALAKVSIGELLIACILPGLLLAALYAVYFVVQAKLRPDLAPPYTGPRKPLGARIRGLVVLIPLAALVLLVTGFIFLGIATPSETAALGAVGALLVSIAYRRLNWRILREALLGTLGTTAMINAILVGAAAFSQLLSFTGAASALVSVATGFKLDPLTLALTVQVLILVLGCFIDAVSIMLIAVPMIMPLAAAVGADPIWLCVLILIQLELGGITPPFGVLLFVIRGLRPDIATATVYRSIVPIVAIQLALCGLLMLFPEITRVLIGAMSARP
ncbi:MAG: TRAP transporter large permease subunit [Alphaproteobacteria bacterium]